MKRMNGFGALALACLLTLGAAGPSLAYGRPGGPEEGLRGAGTGVMRLMNPRALEELKLTASQKEQVRKLLDEARPLRKGSRDGSMQALMRSVRDGSEPDAAAKKKLADEMAGRLLDETLTLSKFHAILTPEQRTLVQARLDRWGAFEGHGKRKPGMQDREARPGFSMGRFSERLNLTEAQKARAEILSRSWEKPMATRYAEIGRLGSEVGRKAFSANPDRRGLETAAKKLAELHVDGISDRARQMAEFRSMLTDEQKKILDERPMGRHPGKRSW